MSDGDGRYLINLAETIFAASPKNPIGPDELMKFAQVRMPLYDKHQESHYNLISALHKSLRGSDPDAALYWFMRMIEGGEDPLYICRRLCNFAVEDCGMADPNAINIALAAKDAYDFMGSPEGELAIAHAVTYLATAPKSNANYVAYKAAGVEAKKSGSLMPPKHILNAPTKLMKEIGYGQGYEYDHNAAGGFSGQDYFPEGYGRKEFYFPKEKGYEAEIKRRLEKWREMRGRK
jgi:putative ATPase